MSSVPELLSVTHTTQIALACFRKRDTDCNHVLLPGIQEGKFGYYIATERKVKTGWKYKLVTFVPRKSHKTYKQLVDIINSEINSET